MCYSEYGDKMNFSFILTERCNWNCYYCDFPSIKNPKDTDIDKINKHMPYISKNIEDNSFIDVQGGEIGLIDINILISFFKYMKDKSVIVSTNGKFLENNYHFIPSIRKKIKEIWWHLCEEPNGKKFKVDYYDKDINIRRGIVSKFLKNLIEMMEKNPQISFDYAELETSKVSPLEAYKNLKNITNLTDRAKNILKSRCNNKITPEICSKFHDTVSIDLVNERILLCHKAMQNYIILSKLHLKKRLNNFPINVFNGKNSCEHCIRLYASKYSFDNMLKQMTKKYK